MAITASADGSNNKQNGQRQSHRSHPLRTIKHGIINLFGTHACYSCSLYAPHVSIIPFVHLSRCAVYLKITLGMKRGAAEQDGKANAATVRTVSVMYLSTSSDMYPLVARTRPPMITNRNRTPCVDGQQQGAWRSQKYNSHPTRYLAYPRHLCSARG